MTRLRQFLIALALLVAAPTVALAKCDVGQPAGNMACLSPNGSAGSMNPRAIVTNDLGSVTGLDAAKIGGGSVSTTEFDRLNGITAYGSSLIGLADEDALEALLDTLANLTSIQGRTVTLADAGANAFWGWDDVAGVYENLTAAEAVAIIATADGAGSGLDADLLDGSSSAAFATVAATLAQFANTTSAQLFGIITNETGGSGVLVGNSAPQIDNIELNHATANTLIGSGGHMTIEGATVWDSGNDGSGSTLDADLLDGISSAGFQAADADLTALAGNAYAANAAAASYLDFFEDSDNGPNRVRLQGPASTADVTATLFAATDTIVGKATSDVFTNKTWDCNGTGNSCANIDLTADVTGDLPYSSLVQVATDRLLGRDTAGTGDTEALTVGGGIEFTGSGGIQRSALTGDVTASAGSATTDIANDAVGEPELDAINGDTAGDEECLTYENGTGGTLEWQSCSAGGVSGVTFDRNVAFNGGGSVIPTGIAGDVEFTYAATITGVTVLCDQSGSIVFDLWKDTYANYPPTGADTITASAKPTVSAATKAQDTTLTGWTTSVSAGDIIRFNVDSASTVTRCTLSLKYTR